MAHPRLAVLPEHDVALALGDDNHGAGTVAVKGTARTRRKFRNVATVGGIRQGVTHVPYPFALHGKIIKHKLIDVGNETGFPISIRHMLVKLQKLLTVMKPVAEVKRITKDKILIVKNIDHARASGSRKQTDGFVPRAVEVLIGRIQRDGKHRTGAPFKSNFRLPILPYRSRAASFGDMYDLLIQMALGQGLA